MLHDFFPCSTFAWARPKYHDLPSYSSPASGVVSDCVPTLCRVSCCLCVPPSSTSSPPPACLRAPATCSCTLVSLLLFWFPFPVLALWLWSHVLLFPSSPFPPAVCRVNDYKVRAVGGSSLYCRGSVYGLTFGGGSVCDLENWGGNV